LAPTCLFSTKVQHPIGTYIKNPASDKPQHVYFSTKVQHPNGTHYESPTSNWHQHVYFLLKSNIRLTPTMKAQHLTDTDMFIFY